MRPESERFLLAQARAAIGEALGLAARPAPPVPEDPELSGKRGVFVTLRKAGELRSCMGTFHSDRPLTEEVRDVAESSAFRDPRFPPLEADELAQVTLSVCVLSDMTQIAGPQDLTAGRHGIFIRKGAQSGTYLPEVAREMGWTAEEMIRHCSQEKAGLGPEGWRQADLYVYTAEEFSEA